MPAPAGWHGEGHYTTARDLARLGRRGQPENQDFAQIVGQKYASAAGRTDEKPQQTALCLRRGAGHQDRYTPKKQAVVWFRHGAAGYGLLIAVTLNDPDDWQDHLALGTEVAYASCQRVTLLESGPVGQVNRFFRPAEPGVPRLPRGVFRLPVARGSGTGPGGGAWGLGLPARRWRPVRNTACCRCGWAKGSCLKRRCTMGRMWHRTLAAGGEFFHPLVAHVGRVRGSL